MAHFHAADPSSPGVAPTMLVMGGVYFVAMLFGAVIVRVPPADYKAGTAAAAAKPAPAGVPFAAAVRSPQFWLLWVALCVNTTAGISIIEKASPLIQDFFGKQLGSDPAKTAAGFVGFISLFNAGGRFVWSAVSDYIGRRATFAIFFLLGIPLYALLTRTDASHLDSVVLFVAIVAVLLSIYGGGFSTMPAYLRDVFGTADLNRIYGLMLTAWSVAGVLGPQLVNVLLDHLHAAGVDKTHAYSTVYYVTSGLLAVGLICDLLVRPLDPSKHVAAPAAADDPLNGRDRHARVHRHRRPPRPAPRVRPARRPRLARGRPARRLGRLPDGRERRPAVPRVGPAGRLAPLSRAVAPRPAVAKMSAVTADPAAFAAARDDLPPSTPGRSTSPACSCPGRSGRRPTPSTPSAACSTTRPTRAATSPAYDRALTAAYAGTAADVGDAQARLALAAFADTVRRYDIPKRYFDDLAAGCRMDLTVSRYATWDELRVYCYHVAGVVGLIMCRVFGLADAAAERQAVVMGEAMQLTNILRDVGEDAAMGRVYLPAEDLARFGVRRADLLAGVVNEPFRQLMRFEVDRARSLYRDGAAGLVALADDGSRFTASAMGVIYSGILAAIERQRYDVFAGRARLSTPRKAAAAAGGPTAGAADGRRAGAGRVLTPRAPDTAVRLALRPAMPTIPMFTPTPVPDAWHAVTAPGGYEWWYFDAEDRPDLRVVAILFEGFVFHPGYLRAYARYRRRPTRGGPADGRRLPVRLPRRLPRHLRSSPSSCTQFPAAGLRRRGRPGGRRRSARTGSRPTPTARCGCR